MELKGKKIAFLGDSITEGCGTSCGEAIYWRVLERLTGAECLGFGIGGSRIAPQHNPVPHMDYERYFASRIAKLPKEADVIVVFGGTNDFGTGDAPFGTLSDREETSFCGAFHALLQKLLEAYPEAQIVVMTPLHRSHESETEYNEIGIRRDHTLDNYVDAIIAIAGYYGVPVLDLFRTSGLQPAVLTIRQKFMPDGLHPNDAGHEKIARRLEAFLQSI